MQGFRFRADIACDIWKPACAARNSLALLEAGNSTGTLPDLRSIKHGFVLQLPHLSMENTKVHVFSFSSCQQESGLAMRVEPWMTG